MKPLRTSEVTNAVPLDDRRGKRSIQLLAALDQRDDLLRDAARRHCTGMSDRQAAAMLHTALTRYASGRWRRTRVAAECPHEAGRLDALLWHILRARDCVLSEPAIRRAIAIREP